MRPKDTLTPTHRKVKPVNCSPELIDHMAVEPYEEYERDCEDDGCHTTEVKLPPHLRPVCEVTHTLRMVTTARLNLENKEAGERWY